MRLNSVKMTGFKSFVDRTTIKLDKDITAIVGPNGCGKSNTIDAIRWVMGESSAKHLRGSQLADVIFNGSGSRKPIGQASVEMLFDNKDGSAGGEFARYEQISVKRVLNRDGKNRYQLNNTNCRRKDITDLFLGTGLGPRSYSIIEQGMISKIIDAKPEELRGYVEEAAGIAKYKSKRKETLQRITNTKDNIERLYDLQSELEKQKQKLQRQAKKAEQYVALKKDIGLAELNLKRCEIEQLHQHHDHLSIAHKKAIALTDQLNQQISAINAELASLNKQQFESNKRNNELQAQFYQLGADIQQLEQHIQQHHEQQQSLTEEVSRHKHRIVAEQRRLQEAEDQHAELTQRLSMAEMQLAQANQHYTDNEAKLSSHEQAHKQDTDQRNALLSQIKAPEKEYNLSVASADRLRRSISQCQVALEQVLSRIEQHHSKSNNGTDGSLTVAQQLLEMSQQLTALQAAEQSMLEQQVSQQSERDGLNAQLAIEQRLLNDALKSEREASAQIKSLESLLEQQQKGDHLSAQWLKTNGYTEADLVMQHVKVKPEWAHALEVVLDQQLHATLSPQPIANLLDALNEDTAVTLRSTAVNVSDTHNDHVDAIQLPTLADQLIDAPVHIKQAVSHIHCIPEGAEKSHITAMQSQLSGNTSLISSHGLWLGYDWLIQVPKAAHTSVLDTLTSLDSVNTALSTAQQTLSEQQSKVTHTNEQIQQLDQSLNDLRRNLHEAGREHKSQQAEYHRIDLQQTRQQQALEQLIIDRDNLQSTINEDQQTLEVNELAQMNSKQQLDELNAKLAQLDETFKRNHSVSFELNNKLKQAMADLRKAELDQQKFSQEMTHAQQKIERHTGSIEHAERLHREAEQKLLQLSAIDEKKSTLQVQLQQQLNLKAEVDQQEKDLALYNQQMAENNQLKLQLEHDTAEQVKQNNDLSAQVVEVSAQVDLLEQQFSQSLEGLSDDEKRLHQQHIEALLSPNDRAGAHSDTGAQGDAVTPNYASEIKQVIKQQQATVSRLTAQLEHMGAINLAAIEEQQEVSDRLASQSQQLDDLNHALADLEAVIHSIDKQTIKSFSSTFNALNDQLKVLYKQLFNGGHAELKLDDTDMLSAGVIIQAQPPGKKLASLQLMSGGEKALTAIALVFSIFKLNPAPFCILDEVDAPLDDANAQRFCKLIKQLSEQVQFLLITHNKVSMEIAQSLTGVTMRESGVSKIVDVDIEKLVD